MTIQERVLRAAVRVAATRPDWTFRPSEIVAALSDLNPGSVRTHVMSRCCVNAPSHHGHRLKYFRRVRRGQYTVLPAQRKRAQSLAEPSTTYGRDAGPKLEAETSVEVRERAGSYLAVVPGIDEEIRSATLDGIAAEVRRHLAEPATREARTPETVVLRIAVAPIGCDSVVAAFEAGVDRTLIRRNLRRTLEERLANLQAWIDSTDEIRGLAWESPPEPDE